MGKGFIQEYGRWLLRWRSIPVLPWVQGAAYFSRSEFLKALQRYESGLKQYPKHPLASFARLDAALCCERLGRFGEGCEHTRWIIDRRLTAQAHVRVRIVRLFVLADRGSEAVSWLGGSARHVASAVDAVASRDGLALAAWPRIVACLERSDAEQGARTLAVDTPQSSLISLLTRLSAAADTISEQCLSEVEARAITDEWGTSLSLGLLLVVGHVRILRREGTKARRILAEALRREPDAPKVLSLLAQSYLLSGDGYNPSYARQLATTACSRASWLSTESQALLAECYYHEGNRWAAFTVAQPTSNLSQALSKEPHAQKGDGISVSHQQFDALRGELEEEVRNIAHGGATNVGTIRGHGRVKRSLRPH